MIVMNIVYTIPHGVNIRETELDRETQILLFNTLQLKGTNEFNTLRGNFTLKRRAYGNLSSMYACQLMACI